MSVGSVMAARLFPAERGGSIPTSALHFRPISRRRFARLNTEWHRTLPTIGALNTMKICYGAAHEGDVFAVAAWSNPVARCLDQHAILELRRFAIAPDAPKNTGSRMLAWMARDIRSRWPHVTTLISYQDCDEHSGTIYRAAGWVPVEVGQGGAWSNRQRWNRTAKRLPRKIRWEKHLTPLAHRS